MSTNTANYNLVKPSGAAPGLGGDLADIAVLNSNMDAIDAALHAHDLADAALDTRLDAIEAAQPFVSLTRTTLQTLTTGVTTAIAFNNELNDASGFHAPNSTDLVVPAGMAGLYVIQAQVGFVANAGGNQRNAIIRVNGAIIAMGVIPPGGASLAPTVGLITRLAVGDIVTVAAHQNSGGNLDTSTAAGFLPAVQMARLGA